MKKIFTLSLLICLLILLATGCTVKKMAKQAHELEMAGMFRQAAELYYRGAVSKPNKVEFKTGLRRAGFMYVEEVSQEINRSYNRGDYQKVVYDYLTINEFVSKVKRTGVELSLDNNVRRMYENAQDQYLNERYDAGLKLLNENRFAEAKKVFEEIHKINPDFRDTKIYLNTATLEPIYQSGTTLFGQRNFMGAYSEWAKVISTDPNYKDTRSRMQDALNERYKEGSIMLMNEDFANAARALGDVYRLNSSYQDVRRLFIEAQSEPLYRQAIQNLGIGRCREAFYAFQKINEIAGGDYRDSGKFRSQALACGSYPIVILSRAFPVHPNDGSEFENLMMQGILAKNDPFLKIHQLPSINSRLHRAFLATTAIPSRPQLKELHDSHGIKALLVINYNQYERLQGTPVKTEKKGVYRQQVTQNGVISFNDSNVNYFEFSSVNKVSLVLTYQLISTLTGEILLSQRLNTQEQSDMHYAHFEDGDIKNLYPSVLRNGESSIDERNYQNLQKLLTAEKGIVPVLTLREKVFKDLTARLSDDLVRFNPER
jgi:tetratricopeptide (TPR) repeat protein